MGPGWLLWTVTLWESANNSELCVSDVVFLKNSQMNPGLANWTVFWSEFFRMEPGLVERMEVFIESLIGGERGVEEVFCLGKFPDGPRLCNAEEFLVRYW